MKKAVLILSVFLFIFTTGCSQLPEGFTQEGYDTGVKALETIDQYLDGNIGKDEAKEKLELYADLLDVYSEKAEEELTETVLSWAQMYCVFISHQLGRSPIDIGQILEYRNSLAEQLGKPAR